MSMAKEFREFAVKGNMVNMAVGIIIGGEFGKIVHSLVADIIMPPIGMLLGQMEFKDLAVTLKAAEGEVAAVTWNDGMFVQNIVDFLIVALAVFMMVKAVNRLRRKKEAEEAQEAKWGPHGHRSESHGIIPAAPIRSSFARMMNKKMRQIQD